MQSKELNREWGPTRAGQSDLGGDIGKREGQAGEKRWVLGESHCPPGSIDPLSLCISCWL